MIAQKLMRAQGTHGSELHTTPTGEERQVQYGVVRCQECDHEWPEELPPLWADVAFSPCAKCGNPDGALKNMLVPGFAIWQGFPALFGRLVI